MMLALVLVIALLGALPAFGMTLVSIYRGRRGDENALRRSANWATWIVVAMCGIYLGLAFVNPHHPNTPGEIFFNGQLISFLILMRYSSAASRLLLTSFLIGVHGLWDGFHLFALPFTAEFVPLWYALACAIFDLGYFGAVLPVCFPLLRRFLPQKI